MLLILMIILIVILASFYLVPSQIMLATSNRLNTRFVDYRGKFPYSHRRRVIIGSVGALCSIGLLAIAGDPIWPSAAAFLVVVTQYISDFMLIKEIAKDLS